MTATIYRFPSKEQITYKISLFNDTEVDAVLICLNLFSDQGIFATYDNLGSIDPAFVIKSLNMGKESWIFSKEFKTIIEIILNNVETK